LNKKITGGEGKIYMTNPFLKVTINVGKGAEFKLNGTLKIINHVGGENPVYINLSENSKLIIDGDFLIGNGVRIYLHKDSLLKIGGKKCESESGITENSKVMVYKSVIIDKDFLCAWDVFISDSDWHTIKRNGQMAIHFKEVFIGEHVWVAPGCSILKGANIGKGSIIGSKSILSNAEYPGNSFIAGNPAKVVYDDVLWGRDI